MRMLYAVLIGNSSIRHGLVDGMHVHQGASIPIPPSGSPLPAGWLPASSSIDAVVIGSVNPIRLAEITPALLGFDAPVLVAGQNLEIPIQNRYSDPAQAGMDRLLNALAASRIWPGQGAVVLDFGTALSVSVVSPDGEFLGGPIAPGIVAAASGLNVRTAQLPYTPLTGGQPPGRLTATSTREALEVGIYWQIAGGAARILEELAAELPFSFHPVATGGDGALFARAIPGIELVDGDLALKGLAACHAAQD